MSYHIKGLGDVDPSFALQFAEQTILHPGQTSSALVPAAWNTPPAPSAESGVQKALPFVAGAAALAALYYVVLA